LEDFDRFKPGKAAAAENVLFGCAGVFLEPEALDLKILRSLNFIALFIISFSIDVCKIGNIVA